MIEILSQHENSDGGAVTGSYRVALPDGRTQIVDYHADNTGYGGYVADVKYEGVAHPGPVAPHPIPKAIPHPVLAHPVAHPAVLAHPIHAVPVHHAPIHPIHPVHPIHG